MDVDRIEAEISRRIRDRHELSAISSKMSAAKHKASASALSELLGWIRWNAGKETT